MEELVAQTWARAQQLAYSRRFPEAIAVLEPLHKQHPANLAFARCLLLCYLQSRHFEQANAVLNRYLPRFQQLIEARRYADAIPELEGFQRLWPGHQRLIYLLLRCYYHTARGADATNLLNKVLQRNIPIGRIADQIRSDQQEIWAIAELFHKVATAEYQFQDALDMLASYRANELWSRMIDMLGSTDDDQLLAHYRQLGQYDPTAHYLAFPLGLRFLGSGNLPGLSCIRDQLLQMLTRTKLLPVQSQAIFTQWIAMHCAGLEQETSQGLTQMLRAGNLTREPKFRQELLRFLADWCHELDPPAWLSLHRLLEMTWPDCAQICVVHAAYWQHREQPQRALEILQDACKRYPGNGDIYAKLAELLPQLVSEHPSPVALLNAIDQASRLPPPQPAATPLTWPSETSSAAELEVGEWVAEFNPEGSVPTTTEGADRATLPAELPPDVKITAVSAIIPVSESAIPAALPACPVQLKPAEVVVLQRLLRFTTLSESDIRTILKQEAGAARPKAKVFMNDLIDKFSDQGWDICTQDVIGQAREYVLNEEENTLAMLRSWLPEYSKG